jgi:LPPG:FO 2-phospho-L-lactate transferase
MITVLAGGTGSVKLVRGLASLQKDLIVICNVGDNFWYQSLYICPDIDTIVYGLAGILDMERGWGIKDDKFNFLEQLSILGEDTWFRIGDKDLAVHVLRTKMIREGKLLHEVTEYIAKMLGVKQKVIPATNQQLETWINTKKEGWVHFQHFWVKRGGKDEVLDVKYLGIESAEPAPHIIESVKDSELIVIAPGNPVTSIGPILAVKRIRNELRKVREKVIAVSPIIGTSPISGPAGKLMNALGIEVSPYGLAKIYNDILGKLVIHRSDERFIEKIGNLGIGIATANIIMRNLREERELASLLLSLTT